MNAYGTGMIGWVSALALTAIVFLAPPVHAEGNPEAGADVWRSCKNCHKIGEGARNGIGPHLDKLFGRVAGSIEGFRYSSAMKKKGAEGLVWDDANLHAYLAKPQKMVPGTRMSFRGMEDEQARADLIAYLKTESESAPAEDPNAANGSRPGIGAAAMKLAGDVDYGEYLSTECVTCHQQSGRADGIPSIIGWPKNDFIRALFEYKVNIRSHQVMKLMTTNLGNEEIAALAAYFGSLQPQ